MALGALGTPAAGAPQVTLLLTGDVMTGRGIDQILPNPADPKLCEPYVRTATGYVELAERANGPIPRPAGFRYVWGDALAELERRPPDLRIANLETSITLRRDCEPKGINYKMSPANLDCLRAFGLDCCVLANNHVMDWGRGSLLDTLDALAKGGIAVAGAGRDAAAASAPAILTIPGKGRVLLFGFATVSSGVPPDWAAGPDTSGVNLLPDLSADMVETVAAAVRRVRQPGDLAVASIHWGGNWGHEIPAEHRRFAHGLIERAGIDLVHGHSSHHPRAIELHQGKLVLYGCGDFIDDYEGIAGYEEFRGDLVLAYLPAVNPSDGRLVGLSLLPFQIRNFRLNRAAAADVAWLRDRLNRSSARFGTRVERGEDGTLHLAGL